VVLHCIIVGKPDAPTARGRGGSAGTHLSIFTSQKTQRTKTPAARNLARILPDSHGEHKGNIAVCEKVDKSRFGRVEFVNCIAA
jgi:hypothetical protein